MMSQPHLWSVCGGGDSGPRVPKGKAAGWQPPTRRPLLERGKGRTLPACDQEDLHQPGSGSGPPLGLSGATQCPVGVAGEHRVAPAFWLH